ncbi:tRNA uridine-5-carboxymethylaminomethyl(34) synthesis enzyme MnmG [Candidatus Dependentiae bacterium]
MNNSCAQDFDVIVVGGGHAGIEAAHAAAKMGSKTVLVTLDIQKIGLMPCNPAVGGVGKGHIVYEISALGGLMPKLCTKTYLQARMLNTKKGPAVQGLRLQIDKFAYQKLAQQTICSTENLTILQDAATQIIFNEAKEVRGIRTKSGDAILAPTVVITAGTFLNGTLHIGKKNWSGGRVEEDAATELSDSLVAAGLTLKRLKTGTPPRLQKSSVDFEKMEKQEAANLNYLFEFFPHKTNNTHACFITRTNEQTHEIIKKNIHLSAMYSGNISGIGPRYCPSIEDKIARFGHRTSHHVFVEPEGAHSEELYPNGISTSLPYEVQKKYVNSIVGFEDAIITKPGYAVEYDFAPPEQLHPTLETKKISGLFLAGQINGTTGYEEAAGQGLMAGINAHLKRTGEPPFMLDRSESYIGVMIDDLVTFGVDEPYRMFTSRAERRLLLRQDNAFLRLTQKGYGLGLIDENVHNAFVQEKKELEQALQKLHTNHSQIQLLKLFDQKKFDDNVFEEISETPLSERNKQTIRAQICYGPYIEREEKEVKKMEQFKQLQIPEQLNYKNLPGLSIELQEKLIRYQPTTIAQASLIPGMTPAAISLLIFKSKQNEKTKS